MKLYVFLFILASIVVGLEFPTWIAAPLLGYVVLAPTFMFLQVAWGWFRFLGIPTPRQLLKGFIRQWQFVRKGPVVTRVHRPRQSSRTP